MPLVLINYSISVNKAILYVRVGIVLPLNC